MISVTYSHTAHVFFIIFYTFFFFFYVEFDRMRLTYETWRGWWRFIWLTVKRTRMSLVAILDQFLLPLHICTPPPRPMSISPSHPRCPLSLCQPNNATWHCKQMKFMLVTLTFSNFPYADILIHPDIYWYLYICVCVIISYITDISDFQLHASFHQHKIKKK